MATFRVHFKSKAGDQYMLIDAPNKEKAEQEAVRAQHRRHDRFPLTFERLAQSLESGERHPLLAAEKKGKDVPMFSSGLYKIEVEKRKRDQARYDDGDLKVASVQEVKK